MLIPDNIHPEQTIYFNGAIILKEIQENRIVDMLDLYEKANSVRGMSVSVFVLCLDWLYLLGLIKMEDQGKVELCT